jgi:RNA polymerase sigma-54 factor
VGLEQKLSLKLRQSLVMTPTLQQAIKLLQMTRLELSDIVNEELVANPVLEEDEGMSEEPAEAELAAPEGATDPADRLDDAGSAERADGAEPEPGGAVDRAAPSSEREAGEYDADQDGGSKSSAEAERSAETSGEPGEPVADTAEAFDQIDVEAYFGEYMDGTATAPRMQEVGEEFSLENRAETPPGLADHLTEQLGLTGTTGPLRDACAFLIGNLDPDGYIRMTLEEVAAGVPCPVALAERALTLVQSFDPTGVGARSLADCLLIQARALHLDSPLLVEVVGNRLAELGSKPVAVLARQLNVPVEELQQVVECIRHLDPKPGRQYDSSRTIYVEPDVAVVKQGDDYVVLFNDDGLPKLRFNPRWVREVFDEVDGKRKLVLNQTLDGEGKGYVREKARAAQWLMKSLDQRKRTIVRVAESIVKKQRDFFEYGVAHLRPLVLRDVAEDIGMHESTVSRVVSNKWMASPRGLLPMKFFFHSAIASTAGGEDVSSLAVKGKIRTLVEAEDPCHPLSDARLSELLARDGIRIARRTVAKYREELHIPASSIRKTDVPLVVGGSDETTPPEESEELK